MNKSIADKVGAVLLAAMLGACTVTGPSATAPTATAPGVTGDSGFLRDYSRLAETKDPQGKTIRAWVSPKLSPPITTQYCSIRSPSTPSRGRTSK